MKWGFGSEQVELFVTVVYDGAYGKCNVLPELLISIEPVVHIQTGSGLFGVFGLLGGDE